MVAAGEFVLIDLDPLGVFQIAPPPENIQQLAPDCWHNFLGVCLIIPPVQDGGIFGFAEFVTAIALLVVIYTVTGPRYHFRIAVAPISILRLTFSSAALIGLGTLLTDVWFSLQWPVPNIFSSRVLWQAVFGVWFFTIVMSWIWFAFISPPKFGRYNYKVFIDQLYSYIIRGSDSELPEIAGELGRSAEKLVAFATENLPRGAKKQSKANEISLYARDVLLLMGNRKFCRTVVSEAPGTAIRFFNAASTLKKYRLPLSQFASNLTTEAILNSDSVLYDEDHGYYSGLIGYVKPFTNALFGDYLLVEGLASPGLSPLDVDHRIRRAWDAEQLAAYGKAVIVTIDSYLETNRWWEHSYALTRALESVRGATRDLYKLDGTESSYENEIYERLTAVTFFFNDLRTTLDEHPKGPEVKLCRDKNSRGSDDMYDQIARLMFEIILDASSVKSPIDTCWQIQHNLVWSTFFDYGEGRSSRIIRFRLRRLLYNEIIELDQLVNYKGARYLGICLNVMGLTQGGSRPGEAALQKVILNWAKRNFLTVRKQLPDVMDASLMGTITLDVKNARLVKTYNKGLRRTAPKNYLNLDPAR